MAEDRRSGSPKPAVTHPGTVPDEFLDKYQPRSLFERHAAARIRQVYIRQIATLIGALAVWHFVSLFAAGLCIAVTLVGEVLDCLVLKHALRRSRQGAPLRPILRATAFSAGCQSATIAFCVVLLLQEAPSGEAALVALSFLMAGAVNAGFILTHHLIAAQVKLSVLACSLPIYLWNELRDGQLSGPDLGLRLLEIAFMAYLAYTFLSFAYRSWTKRLANERALMAAAAELTAINADLETARRDAEAAARAKSAFLATMSHEIRTPLHAISGMSELLKARELPEDAALQVDTIRNAAASLLRIISDVLDFSRLDADRLSLAPAPFSPVGTLKTVTWMLQPVADEKSIRLTCSYDGSLPSRGLADKARLTQILLNLVGNALKFTDEGEVAIHAGAEPRDDGWLMTVTITDSGRGVQPDQAEMIFEPFTQGSAGMARQQEGSGLGLSISRSLARRMGGDVTLLPPEPGQRPEQGATFALTVPLGPTEDADETPVPDSSGAPDTAQADAISLPPLTVLIADDSEVNRLVLEHFLKSQPLQLLHAETGRQAVDLAQQNQPDVILMDVSMPVMDGLEATREIRASDIRQPHIIGVTANAFDADRQACLEAGMDAFLSKPVTRSQLLAALANRSAARP